MFSTTESPLEGQSAVVLSMNRLSKAQITARLGREPEAWDFRGQCFDVGEGLTKVCALTEQPTRFCFTLKPILGKGRVVIGPSAFIHLRRFAPALFLKLERGRQFLQVAVEAEQADAVNAAIARRVQQSEKKLVSLKIEARKRIRAYRTTIRKGELPAYLAALRTLLERPEPKFGTSDARILWCDQSTTDFEQELLQSKSDGSPVTNQLAVTTPLPPSPAIPKQNRVRHPKPQEKPAETTLFAPIPEIEF